MSVSIRQARLDDAARIAGLHVSGWEEFHAFVPREVMEARTVESRTGEWAEFLSADRPSTWTTVAELDGSVVGFASTRLLDEPEYGALGEIKNLFVDATVRGAGVGRRLLVDAARWLQASGGEPIVLYSFTENPYRGVYDRLGAPLSASGPPTGAGWSSRRRRTSGRARPR